MPFDWFFKYKSTLVIQKNNGFESLTTGVLLFEKPIECSNLLLRSSFTETKFTPIFTPKQSALYSYVCELKNEVSHERGTFIVLTLPQKTLFGGRERYTKLFKNVLHITPKRA